MVYLNFQNLFEKFSSNKIYLVSLICIVCGKISFISYMVLLENHLNKNDFAEILLFFSVQASFILFALIGSDEIFIKNYDIANKKSKHIAYIIKVLILIIIIYIISLFFFKYYSSNKNFYSFLINNYELILISSISYFFTSITRIESKSLFFIIIENFLKNFIIMIFVLILWDKTNLNNFSKILWFVYFLQFLLSISYFFYIIKNINSSTYSSYKDLYLFKNFQFTFLRNLYAFSMSGFDILLISFISLGFVLADYRIAAISAGLFSIFLHAVNVILLPEYSSKVKSNNLLTINKDYNQKTNFILLISTPIFIFSLFFFEYSIEFFLKNNYSHAALIFKILVSAQFINILLGPTQYLIFLFDKNFKLNLIYQLFVIINFVVFFISLKFGGIILLATMIFISNFIFKLINIIILKKLNFKIVTKGKIIVLIIYSILLSISLGF